MMKLQCFVTIFLSIWTLAVSQDFKASTLTKPQKRHSLIASPLKHARPKTILVKRVPGISPLISPKGASRILNKTPVNLLQNGPYYINHYIYCDNIDQHAIDQIKAGSFSSNKDIQLLNLHKDDFHGTGQFTGNKEFHVLHLPNDKKPNFDDVKLHLSLLNAHKSPEAPEIDLDFNKHLGNFEVNLEDIKPPNIDTSFVDSTKSSENDIVTPLIQGHVSSGLNHKHNDNLVQLADYLNGNGHSGKEQILQHYGNFDSNHATHSQGGILELPHFEKHPLEHDSGKASYDTPGAVDSYGHPATESYSPQNSYHNLHIGSFPNGFGNGFKGNDLYQSEEYINQLNEVNGLQRRRRMDITSTTEKPKTKKIPSKDDRHSNHKYD